MKTVKRCDGQCAQAHTRKQAPLSSDVWGCELRIDNEKNIDLTIYSVEILESPRLPINIINAGGLHGQMLLALISDDFTCPIIIHY